MAKAAGEGAPGTRHRVSSLARAAQRMASEIRRRLLAAYDGGKRDLPWRRERDPYRIWVSEVMLQQTRVETVIPYYRRWVERFPTLEALARAEEEEVLGVWQGLGYYSRARRLHGAARVVRERLGGVVPASAEELKELPGVGDYTAGAVASIAFGEAVPAVDGNVRRVLSRLFDLPDPSPKELREAAQALVDRERPGDFNQALMELGATVCTPRGPMCGVCPLNGACSALEAGTVEDRPVRKAKKPVPEVEVAVVVAVWDGGMESAAVETGERNAAGRTAGSRRRRVLLRRRPDRGLLAGMWEFPGVEVGDPAAAPEEKGDHAPLATARRLASELGLTTAAEPEALPAVQHTFSHLKATYRPFLFRVSDVSDLGEGRWVSRSEYEALPLPVAQRKMGKEVWEDDDG